MKTLYFRKLVIISLILLLGFITACSGDSNDNGINDGVVTITTAAEMDSGVDFRSGETIEDNVHTRWIKDELGINVEHLWTVGEANDAFATKIRLDLAGNQKLPDVFNVKDKLLLNELMDAGKLRDISAEFDKHASDRIKSIYDQYPEAFNAMTRDGKVYGLPLFNGFNVPSIMWIRQDWLDKLELKAPETIEELEQVMEAFKTGDLDGNGKNDTLPLSISIKEGMASTMGSVDWLFGSHDKYFPTKWAEKDGELVYGSIQPSVKKGLAKLNEWMDKGYIDPEAAVLDGNQSADQFVAGNTGIWFGPYWVPNGRINPLLDNVPGADFEPYSVPSGADGTKGVSVAGLVSRWVLFEKDFEHMDKYLEYHDRIFDRVLYDAKPDTGRFYYGYHEGYDYKIEKDGTVNTEQRGFDGWITPKHYMSFFGNTDITRPTKYVGSVRKFYENPEAEPENPEDVYVLGWSREQLTSGYYASNDREFNGYRDKFEGAPTEGMSQYQERLKTAEIDAFIKIVYGDQPVDSFDDFVDNWKSSGGDQITEEVNAWYETIN